MGLKPLKLIYLYKESDFFLQQKFNISTIMQNNIYKEKIQHQ